MIEPETSFGRVGGGKRNRITSRERPRWSTFVILVLLLILSAVLQAAEQTQDGAARVTGSQQVWRAVTLSFGGPEASEQGEPNPFLDYRMRVTFSHGTGDGATRVVVPGYFAGDGRGGETGRVWRVHFVPNAPGIWTWSAAFRQGKNAAVAEHPLAGDRTAFHGARGQLTIAPKPAGSNDPRDRGMLRYVGERYRRYAATGEPHLKVGADSPENLLGYVDFDGTYRHSKIGKRRGKQQTDKLHRYQPHVRDWRPGDPTWGDGKGKGLIGGLNYLASKGVNSVYFLTMNVQGDGKDVWPWTSHEERVRFDISKLDQWNIVFDHMDRLGIMLHVVTQEQENDQLLDGGKLGLHRKLYYRELVARFSHHKAITWNLGEENTNTDAQRRAFAKYVRDLDPYEHLIVVHTFPGKYDQVYEPLLGYDAFDGPSLQTNDTYNQTLRWVKRSAEAGRPWVVCLDEIGPAHTGVKPDKDDPNHDEVRKKHLWGNLMAGGAGVEWYFGYKYAHNDLNCEDWRSRDRTWDQSRYAAEFFHKYLPFDQMRAANELVEAPNAWCFAKPGDVLAIYLPEGGAAKVALPKGSIFAVHWYNPRTGGELQTGPQKSVVGPQATIGPPPSDPGKDWAVLLRRANR